MTPATFKQLYEQKAYRSELNFAPESARGVLVITRLPFETGKKNSDATKTDRVCSVSILQLLHLKVEPLSHE